MATKKCPKCGEENPAEAVMCWACYTPLAGGAAAVAGGGLVTPRGGAAAVTPAATAAAEDNEKTPIDPKIFLVGGLLLLALIIGGFTTGIFGSLGGGGEQVAMMPPTEGDDGQPPRTTIVNNPVPPAPPAPPSLPTGNTTGTIAPATALFRIVVPPDPRYANGTAAIVATTPTVTPAQARTLAQTARQQLTPGGRWSEMQILVFNNEGAARAFQKYQAQRRTSRLTINDYQALASQGLWSSVPSFYESKGKNETFYNPSGNPTNWWSGRR